jgi:hypothetical protein
MEADNDDFPITAPTEDHIDRLARPLDDARKITKQKPSRRTPIQSKERPTTNAADTTTGDPSSLQHVGLRIERMQDVGLKLTNPKLVDALLVRHGMPDCNPTILPYVDGVTLRSTQDRETLVDPSTYRAVVGSLRFVADTTCQIIAHPVGILGPHLVRPALRHMAATKRLLRYLRETRIMASPSRAAMAYASRAIQTPTTPTATTLGRPSQACLSRSTVVRSTGRPRARQQLRARALKSST